jgi:hypothetical protein
VLAAYFVHCFGMDNAAELRHSDSDEVFLVDDEMMGDQGFEESAAMIKNGKILYPFLEGCGQSMTGRRRLDDLPDQQDNKPQPI